MRKVKYEDQEKGTGGTETHLATDQVIKGNSSYPSQAMEEGFAASDGVRGVTSASGGRVKHPEKDDASLNDPVPESIEDENPGLADD
jgi:hypothetical protein